MVIRVISVPDSLDLPDFDEVFRTVLGWDGLGFIFRVHGQEFNSFRRASRSKILREFQLRPSETSLYTCGTIDLWEWEFRLLDQEPGTEGDEMPLCLGGRGAAPGEQQQPGGQAAFRCGVGVCGCVRNLGYPSTVHEDYLAERLQRIAATDAGQVRAAACSQLETLRRPCKPQFPLTSR